MACVPKIRRPCNATTGPIDGINAAGARDLDRYVRVGTRQID
jgi:hypothetical protein